ncbi:MAG TPA: DUF177 domain-containing protein [Noviherbaspirillum sp.]|nr:DUF177 domain-containing protein [Noviherbaspirillum sp.]
MIDAFEFCRLKDKREGEIAVADLPRLAKESVDKFGVIKWSLQGGSNSRRLPQLNLLVAGEVRLMCQRCLFPFVFEIASASVLVLAQDEDGADEIDALLADESVEVVVGSHAFNVAQLIEDEVLLTIPLSPKHEACPAQLLPAVEKEGEKVSPFAVLKNLKQ